MRPHKTEYSYMAKKHLSYRQWGYLENDIQNFTSIIGKRGMISIIYNEL